jgi:hypothetical protein
MQYVFFILVHSDFYGIPLPDHVSYTKQTENKKFHGYKTLHTTMTLPFGKTEECDSTNKKNDNGELQEQELVLLL